MLAILLEELQEQDTITQASDRHQHLHQTGRINLCRPQAIVKYVEAEFFF
jgi:hypothetical protein